jgi:GTPase SAR1 family protein
MLGHACVGKTSYLSRLADNFFLGSHMVNIGSITANIHIYFQGLILRL